MEVKLMLHAANGILGDPPHPKGSLGGTDLGNEPPNKSGCLSQKS
jgi:hypothetical protein